MPEAGGEVIQPEEERRYQAEQVEMPDGNTGLLLDRFENILSWAEEDRPREKLLLKGKAALSDAELIAILIGSGTRSLSAVDVAKLAVTAGVLRIEIERPFELCYRPAVQFLFGVDYRQVLVRIGEAWIQGNRLLIFPDCKGQ